jgi:hypothetical protein
VSAGLAVALLGLALVDSTSFGTLLIPVWLMLAPGRVAAGRVVLFLGTVAASYLLLGVALLTGAARPAEAGAALAASPPARAVQLLVGVAMLVAG